MSITLASVTLRSVKNIARGGRAMIFYRWAGCLFHAFAGCVEELAVLDDVELLINDHLACSGNL